MEVNDKIFDLIIFFLLNCKLIAFNLLIINRGSTNFSSNGLLILKIKLDQFWLKIELSFKEKKKKEGLPGFGKAGQGGMSSNI